MTQFTLHSLNLVFIDLSIEVLILIIILFILRYFIEIFLFYPC